MTGVDTNVLVRYLTQDEPRQARRATRFFEELASQGTRCMVGSVVLCELVWVLHGAYRLERDAIADTLDRLLNAAQVEIERRDVVMAAVGHYRRGPGDFADYVIGESHLRSGCDATVTFDRRLARVPAFRLLA